MINRGTVPTKIDRVHTATVLSRCSPGLGPGSTTVSSRCRPVCLGFTTVKPSSVPVHAGGVPVPVPPGDTPVFGSIENDSNGGLPPG